MRRDISPDKLTTSLAPEERIVEGYSPEEDGRYGSLPVTLSLVAVSSLLAKQTKSAASPVVDWSKAFEHPFPAHMAEGEEFVFSVSVVQALNLSNSYPDVFCQFK